MGAQESAASGAAHIEIGLNAAIVAVDRLTPLILVVDGGASGAPDGLPFGPFDPLRHRTMEIGLRSWVATQADLKLGCVQELYTFGDRVRHAQPSDTDPHVMSVGYLALTRRSEESDEVLRRSGAGGRA